MSEQRNAQRIRTIYQLSGGGDVDAFTDALADDVVWHVPGRGANAGAHRGKEAVLAFFGRVIPDLRSFRIDVHDIVANDDHVVVLVRYEHERNDRRFEQLGTEVFHLDENGQIKEFWALIDDTAAFDEFFA
ncbi:MAG TPA: nuclear transport factor 2 family protein [Candidatus Limnocylindria bacterium]|nr:nuclear transport factor 2 family protein [Candidatus Limnocylindria bacterium]